MTYSEGEIVFCNITQGKDFKGEVLTHIPKNSNLFMNKVYKKVFGINETNRHKKELGYDRYIVKSENEERFYLIGEKYIIGKAKK